MKKVMIAFMMVCVVNFTLFAGDTLSGIVKSVIDGNTIEIEGDNNEIHTIQLTGIDSPEPGQEYGDQAKAYLEKLVLQKSVVISLTGKDRWGNQLATVIIDGNRDIRHDLLKVGLAWTAERNPLPELEAIKELARKDAKGLWKQDNPTPPWIYRRQQTMMQVKGS
jgi:micrococcal nuclease